MIVDVEKPRIYCPKNIVIKSDVDVKVSWSDGMFTDNVGIQSVTYNPPNGSMFISNKNHKVIATVVDVQGNKEECKVVQVGATS